MGHKSGGRQDEYSSAESEVHSIDAYSRFLESNSQRLNLPEIGHVLNSTQDSTELCGRLAEFAATALQVSHAFVHLAEDRPILVARFPCETDEKLAWCLSAFVDRVISRNEMVVTPQLDRWIVDNTIVEANLPFQAVLSLPVQAEGRAIGTLTIGSTEKRTFSTAEANLLSAITTRASSAVLLAMRTADLRRHVERLEAFSKTIPSLIGKTDEQEFFEAVCKTALQVFSCQCACILTRPQEADERPHVEMHTASEMLPRPRVPKVRALAREAAREGKPVLIHSEEENGRVKQLNLGFGCETYRSTLVAPFSWHGENLGSIILFSADRNGFDKGIESAATLANNIAPLVRNIRLLAAEREKQNQKDTLLSNITHDLRTPLSSIKGYSQLLMRRLKDVRDERTIEMLGIIDSQASEMNSMIGQIQDLARIDKGSLELITSNFDIADLVKIETERLSVISSQHEFVFTAEQGIPYGVWDKERIRRVVSNLISNAVKYSPKGGEVTVTVKRGPGNVVVSVGDKGIGIASRHLAKIFRRFYRVTDRGKETYPGMGLGLNLSNETVKAHGGKMWVESEVGKGSTFYFSLPYSKERERLKVAEERSIYSVEG